MRPAEYSRILVRNWLLILVCLLLGTGLALGVVRARPASYKSTGQTTVMTAATSMTVDQIFSTTQAIRVTMPDYLARATSDSVVKVAADRSGLTAEQVKSGLSVTREPDSTVIQWALSGPAGVEKALTAAMEAFAQDVGSKAPVSQSGQPLIVARPSGPASQGVLTEPIPPALAVVVGALGGLLVGTVLAASREGRSARIDGRDAVEMALGVPVLAELPRDPAERGSQWRYVTAYLNRIGATGSVHVLSEQPVAPAELTALQDLLDRGRNHATVTAGAIRDDGQSLDAAADSDAVVLVLLRGVDDASSLRTPIANLRNVARGPVVAVLDDARGR